MNNNYDIVSDLYDIYAQFDFDITFYLNRYAHFKGRALELMAGTGRVSIPLLKSNINLDCVDLSQGLLNKLSHKLIANNLHSNLYCQNICTLSLPHRYDAILIACNSFAEIIKKDDRINVLHSVYGHLNESGEFLITLHNPPVRRKSIDSKLTHVSNYTMDGKTVSFYITSKENQNSTVHVSQFYEIYNGDGCMLEKRMLNLSFALLSIHEIEQELHSGGFEIKELYGNYDKSTFDESVSPFIIIVAKRR